MAETVFEQRLDEIHAAAVAAYGFGAGSYTYAAMSKVIALREDWRKERADLHRIADEMHAAENFIFAESASDDDMARGRFEATAMPFAIGDETVLLTVTFDFVAGSRATGPSYASGGEPADPAEVDVRTIEWTDQFDKSRGSKHLPKSPAADAKWYRLDYGPLFNLIAGDQGVYEACVAVAEDTIRSAEYVGDDE